MEGIETIATRTSVYTVLEPGIIEQRLKPGVQQSVADAQANCITFIKLAGPRGAACLVDLREAGPAQPGVNDVYHSPRLVQHTHALALVSGSLVGQMLGNLFLAMRRPPMPTRMFDSRGEALAWLRQQLRAVPDFARSEVG